MGRPEEEAATPTPVPVATTPPKPTAPSPRSPIQPPVPAEDGQRPSERAPDVPPELCKAPQPSSTPTGLVEGVSLPHVTSTIKGQCNSFSGVFLWMGVLKPLC